MSDPNAIVRGEDRVITETIDAALGISLIGAKVRYTVCRTLGSAPAIRLRTANDGGADNQVLVVDPLTYSVTIAGAASDNLEAGAYVVDAWAILPDGTRHMLKAPRQFLIQASATQFP